MKSFHRIVATGAVGGLAAVTVAASGAFACTAQASLTVGDGSPFVEPGQQVPLQVKGFSEPSEGSEIQILWMDAVEQRPEVLARAAAPSFAASAGATVTIPSTMERNSTGYFLVARQFSTASPTKLMASASVSVFRRALPTTSAVQPPAETPGSPSTATPAEVTNNQPTPATPATENAPLAATPAARSNAAAPTAATTASAAAAPRTAAAPATAATPVAPAAEAQAAALAAATAELPKVQPVPAPAELWSGLDASKAPSLLDAPAPSSQSSTPVGGILAGSGILALAGAALVASRRRLALSVARRR